MNSGLKTAVVPAQLVTIPACRKVQKESRMMDIKKCYGIFEISSEGYSVLSSFTLLSINQTEEIENVFIITRNYQG